MKVSTRRYLGLERSRLGFEHRASGSNDRASASNEAASASNDRALLADDSRASSCSSTFEASLRSSDRSNRSFLPLRFHIDRARSQTPVCFAHSACEDLESTSIEPGPKHLSASRTRRVRISNPPRSSQVPNTCLLCALGVSASHCPERSVLDRAEAKNDQSEPGTIRASRERSERAGDDQSEPGTISVARTIRVSKAGAC